MATTSKQTEIKPTAEMIWRTCGEIRLSRITAPANWATSPIQSSSLFLRLAIHFIKSAS
jgi:hypothetical protein